jgi:hypothetical protein
VLCACLGAVATYNRGGQPRSPGDSAAAAAAAAARPSVGRTAVEGAAEAAAAVRAAQDAAEAGDVPFLQRWALLRLAGSAAVPAAVEAFERAQKQSAAAAQAQAPSSPAEAGGQPLS